MDATTRSLSVYGYLLNILLQKNLEENELLLGKEEEQIPQQYQEEKKVSLTMLFD